METQGKTQWSDQLELNSVGSGRKPKVEVSYSVLEGQLHNIQG